MPTFLVGITLQTQQRHRCSIQLPESTGMESRQGAKPMVIFTIQPGTDAWYVLQDGQPTSRHHGAHLALTMALLLTRRTRERGELANFAGIVTEVMERPDAANRVARALASAA